MPEPWLTRLENGDRLALSRLITLASNGQLPGEVRDALANSQNNAPVIAITGSAGVGKSTLIGKLIEIARADELSVAVLACDPQSPLTGGALLGDRIRMSASANDDGVFIRSLPVASGQQSLAMNLDCIIRLTQAFGFDVVLLETVGAGQGDTAVRDVADVVVVLVQPEAGDDLQWEKAGLLEVADLVVVNKADLPRAAHVETQLRELLNLPGCREVPVLRASSVEPSALPELWQAMWARASESRTRV